MLNAFRKKNGSPIRLQETDRHQWHSSLEILEKKQFKVDAIYCQTVKEIYRRNTETFRYLMTQKCYL